MQVKEILDIIKQRGYTFEVASSEAGKSYGKQTLNSVSDLHGGFEDYLKRLSVINKTTTLAIQLFSKNGTSYIKRDFFLVNTQPLVDTSTVPTKPVDTSTKTIEDSTKRVEVQQSNLANMNTITKSDIECVRLETKVQYLEQQVNELKASNKKLEQGNDELRTENNKLVREHSTNKERHELEYRKKELDLLSEKRGGLSGIMEDLKTAPPELYQFIAGLIPNHPMNGTGKTETLPANTATKKHENSDAQACIEVTYEALINQPPEIVGMIHMLNAYFIKYPDHLAATYEKWITPKNNTQTTS